jgi:predicted ATPase
MINKISFKNYKLFKELQTLELKPITIVIGKNNTGKSAVLKLPAIISGSLRGSASNPLKLNHNGVKIGQSNGDLFYNKIMVDPLEFLIESDDESVHICITGDRHYNIKIIKYSENKEELNLNEIELLGLLRSGNSFQKMNLKYDYIDSVRKYPDPQFSDIYEEYKTIGLTGEDAFKLLAQYYKDSNPILNDIKTWFRENFEGWQIGVKDISGSSPSYEIVLSTPHIADVNIVNTGSGIRQALPLIVRSFMPESEKTLIIIEEPETHLHPAAHGNLAERFVDSYLEDSNKNYLIETHSQNFILRTRALVASGKLDKKDLAIYYVDYDEASQASTIRKIEVDEDGNLPNDDWPEGVFNETSLEVERLINAQMRAIDDE